MVWFVCGLFCLWFGLVCLWFGLVWFGLVWFGLFVVWFVGGVVWVGLVWVGWLAGWLFFFLCFFPFFVCFFVCFFVSFLFLFVVSFFLRLFVWWWCCCCWHSPDYSDAVAATLLSKQLGTLCSKGSAGYSSSASRLLLTTAELNSNRIFIASQQEPVNVGRQDSKSKHAWILANFQVVLFWR